MSLHITLNDEGEQNFDDAMRILKEDLAKRGDKKSGKIVVVEPQVDILPHGGAEFDGDTFNEYELGSWRIR